MSVDTWTKKYLDEINKKKKELGRFPTQNELATIAKNIQHTNASTPTPAGMYRVPGVSQPMPWSEYWQYKQRHPELAYQNFDIPDLNSYNEPSPTPPAEPPAEPVPYEPSLEEKLQLQQQWLNAQHVPYLQALQTANQAYGNTLASLAQRVNAPESHVGISFGGNAPVSFLPRQTLQEAGTLEA